MTGHGSYLISLDGADADEDSGRLEELNDGLVANPSLGGKRNDEVFTRISVGCAPDLFAASFNHLSHNDVLETIIKVKWKNPENVRVGTYHEHIHPYEWDWFTLEEITTRLERVL